MGVRHASKPLVRAILARVVPPVNPICADRCRCATGFPGGILDGFAGPRVRSKSAPSRYSAFPTLDTGRFGRDGPGSHPSSGEPAAQTVESFHGAATASSASMSRRLGPLAGAPAVSEIEAGGRPPRGCCS
jgi:hypothetical protein